MPTVERWVAETGFALDEREEVLNFVADPSLARQPPGWGCTAGDDAIDGTSVLDIKPWMREFDVHGKSHQPPWSVELMRDYH